MKRINGFKSPRAWSLSFALLLLGLGLSFLLSGCGKGSADQALDSNANGFICLDCRTKFYTDRDIFPNHCPACQKASIEMVVGFKCAADGHITYAPRGKGFTTCEQCGKTTNALLIPTEAELKNWGAAHQTAAEVGVN